MRDKMLSILLLVLIICFVVINTIIVERHIDETILTVEKLDIESEGAKHNAEQIHNSFMAKQRYISLTVNHEDMTSIEDCFVEMIGFLSVNDTQNAEVAKYRLRNSLEHLRRLSGYNIDAII